MGAKLGQHFLRDEAAIAAIVSACGAGKVLEIGPGRGALTLPLLAAGASVTAVEKDDRLAERLSPKLTVINEDFLAVDLAALGGGWRVVGNLPYAVATPILQKLLSWDGWDEAVLMFQKEVAERVCAPVGGPDYGLLRLSVLLRAEAELLLELPPSAFAPPPKVWSAVVRVRRLPAPRLKPEEERAFWRPVKAAFAQRRKTAAKTIAGVLGVDKTSVEDRLERLGLRRDARPESIPFEAWLALGRELA
ncbi:MAG: 16S rRNA (adenine(1518)-N(6)/adenine(1519)-N(6))-dimethyltransferase RsmA [Elusimicrobiota bacterium]|nr:16S rRNA (adenine(1518)-N(6)/adenine(1519)-N(6))-dimethyltransferase RsmA [Elusimicrobiota bacterium]